MYAIIDDRGRQYTVRQGQVLSIDYRKAEADAPIVFDRVLLVRSDASTTVGTPVVPGARVKATVLGEEKARKIVVRKFRRRKNYRRKQGHRQRLTRVRIEAIEA